MESRTDLNQLVIFAKVVEARSFTGAGRILGLPKSTVSRKVAQLEERLGVQLLQRTTRRISLTDVGAAFYERCARIATEIAEAEEAVLHVNEGPRGVLRVHADPELGVGLRAAVCEFLVVHDQVDIELEFSAGVGDLIEEGFDVSLRLEAPEEPAARGLVTRRVHGLARVLVASPDYYARHGTPQAPEQLEDHAIVIHGNPRGRSSLQLCNVEGEVVVVQRRPRLIANDPATMREALLGGVGIGLIPAFECVHLLRNGELRTCLDEWTRFDESVHVAYPTARHLSGKVQTFLDFVSERFEFQPFVAKTEPSKLAAVGATGPSLTL